MKSFCVIYTNEIRYAVIFRDLLILPLRGYNLHDS